MIRIMTFQLSSNDWGACSKLTYLHFAILLYEYTSLIVHATFCATFMFTLYRVKEINQATETIHIPCLNLLPSTRPLLDTKWRNFQY